MSQQLNRTQRLGLPLATPGAIMNPFEYFNGAMERIEEIITNRMYPVGAIYCNATDNRNPNTILGFGVWEAYSQGRVLVGDGTSDQAFIASSNPNDARARGGASTHTLGVTEMPSHRHSKILSAELGGVAGQALASGHGGSNDNYARIIPHQGNPALPYRTNFEGDNQPHNNLQPYQVVYMWRRIS